MTATTVRRRPEFKTLLLLVMTAFLVSACSTANSNMSESTQLIADPYEKTNRRIFKFNTAVDKAVLRPISKVYKTIIPKPIRKGVTNILANLKAPFIFANDLLQGKPKRAGQTFKGFVVNSTVGIGGIFKVSDKMGIKTHDEDFGQTLAEWGVGDGNFVMLPFLGPSTPRDTVGAAVEFFADPVNLILEDNNLSWVVWTRLGLGIVDARARNGDLIDSLYTESDPYIMTRTGWIQARRAALRDGAPAPIDPDAEDPFDFDDEDYDE